jgi:predicted ATPase/DNA-binding CsgD family transcriptional regulator
MTDQKLAERVERQLKNNLPAQVTTILGRERDVEAVHKLLLREEVRLLTLSGPGGVGKTRLSLRIAAGLVEDFDTICFVPLAAIHDAALLPNTIAQTLDIKESPDQPLLQRLKEILRPHQLLLVLDNFEQITGAVSLLSELLAACPALKLVVTGRSALHLYGEHEYRVQPLALPDLAHLPDVAQLVQIPAVSLFVERAQAARSDFALTEANAAAVAEICVRLDGLPLALELAAARVKLLPPQALLNRLVGGYGYNSLQLLTGGPLNNPSRQQTLINLLDWSYNLLNPAEQKLFRQMAVFVGGCTLPAVETVCRSEGEARVTVLMRAESLIDKNLVKQVELQDAEPRLVLLETVREYALSHLTEAEAGVLENSTWLRHCGYFTSLAETAEPELTSANQAEWLALVERDHHNFRAAMKWALDNDQAELMLRLSGAVWRFWYTRGYYSEGRNWLETALSRFPQVGGEVRAKVLIGAGVLAHAQSDNRRARAAFEESLELFRAANLKGRIAIALNNLGAIAVTEGEFERAFDLHSQSLELRRELGDKYGIASSLSNLGAAAISLNDYRRALPYLEESLEIRRELGDTWGVALSLNNLGAGMVYLKDYPKAFSYHRQSLGIRRGLGDKWGMAVSLANMAQVAFFLGNWDEAYDFSRESLALRQELDDKLGIAVALEIFARLAAAQTQFELAARLLGAAASLRDKHNLPLEPYDMEDHAQLLATIKAELSRRSFELAWEEGRSFSQAQAIGLTREVQRPQAALPDAPAPGTVAAPAEEKPPIPLPVEIPAPASPKKAAKQAFGGLTDRERNVALLVAQGKSNRLIAQELFVSERTVEKHVENILSKLQFISRAQIAAWSVEKGLARNLSSEPV